ncbi:MAG: Pyridinium-3,5-biscarboxylic acid mononucleotide synthase [Phycisphaerae bacterium]|nr:Pyridinium-3,5-biscarboxylic acid mononucleotide synthase [Phycisphaerae bacterium]
MEPNQLADLLNQFKAGQIDLADAIERLRRLPFESLEFATIDHHRRLRCGFPEVIYCPGKTVEQVVTIFTRLAEHGGDVLATRAGDEQVAAVLRKFPSARHHATARAITLRQTEPQVGNAGLVGIISAGTSDLPVAEEARVTAEIMGAPVTTIYDVGVAGLHRLLGRLEDIHRAKVLVVVAGMEGALASVVGGLVSSPVVGVPTSVGYGAHLGGIAPLLTMLNSCAAGVSVVNIDNGFAAGYIAALISRQSADR